jgi:hypothetical protein
MLAATPSAVRAVHVPGAGRKAARESRPRLPEDLARLPAALVLRLVAWTGLAPREPPRPRAPVAPLPATTAARVAFAQIAWNGSRPPPPTGARLAKTVQSVLSSFRWGD